MLSECAEFHYFCLLRFFFFFKQKTAYEMRISDWSSDVCSSDLIGLDPDSGGFERLGHLAGVIVGVRHDRRHHRLHRREPQRQLARIMFDQDADEALVAAEDRAVEHARDRTSVV